MKPVSLNAATVALTPTTSADTDTLYAGGTTVRIRNAGSVDVFVKTSASSSAATTSDCCIGAGHTESFTIDQADRFVSAICASGSATVYVQRSDGI